MNILPSFSLGRSRLLAITAVLVMVLAGFVGLAVLTAPTAAAEDGETIMESKPMTLAPGQRVGEHDLGEKPPEYYMPGNYYYYFGSKMKKGDINGDGIEDLAVIAGGFYANAVFIYDGSSDVMFPNLQMSADSATWKISLDLNYVKDIDFGDVNGDGYDDLIIGRAYYTTGDAILFYGGPDWNSRGAVSYTSYDARFHNGYRYYAFGSSVALGDLDGDGYDDVIVSAPGRDYVYWFYGSPTMSGYYDAPFTYDGRIYGQDAFGHGGMVAGDFNGDGRDELAMGQPYQYNSGSYSGSVVFISPESNIRSFYTGSCTGNTPFWDFIEYTGWSSYCLVGSNMNMEDYNGDGYDDLIFGQNAFYRDQGRDARYVWLIEGDSTFPTGTNERMNDASNYDYRFIGDTQGFAANSWGDYDNDGKYDIFIGDYNTAAYVFMNDAFNGSSSQDIYTDSAVLEIIPDQTSYWAYPGYYYFSYYSSDGPYRTVVMWDRDGDGRDELFISDPRINIDGQWSCGAIYGVTPFDMFGIGDFESEGGDLPDGKTFYSEYKSYSFSMSAWNRWDPTLTDMEVTMLFNDYQVMLSYDGVNGFQKVSDPLDFLKLDPNWKMEVIGDELKITFNVTFTFDLDECNIDVIFTAKAAHMSYTETIENVGKIRNKLVYLGEFEAYWDSHDGTRFEVGDLLKHGAWLPENSHLRLTGMKLVYNGTENFQDDLGIEPYYPSNDVFHIVSKSSIGGMIVDDDSSGTEFETLLPAGDRPLTITYETYQVGVPSNKMINSIPDFMVHVDVDTPTIPPGIQIHADDFYDENTRVDNDGELYVTWEVPGEYNSGIKHYQVRINEDDQTIFDTKATFAKVTTQATGDVTVEIRAIDRVGHVGDWGSSSIYIDDQTLEFSNPTPAEDQWFNIIDPEVGIVVSDAGGFAVVGSSIEYAVSYDDGETYGEWTSADVVLNAPTLQVRVAPMLMEGSMNLVKFRAMDEAGNSEESEPQRISIDISGVEFGDLTVTGYDDWEYTWLDTGDVELNIDVLDVYSGVKEESIQFKLSTRGRKDLDSKPWNTIETANLMDVDENTVGVTLGLSELLALEMGDANYIQFRARDVLDNAITYSDIFNLWVNTEPVPMISSPEDGAEFVEGDIIIFDASASMDYDGDDLMFTWADTYVSDDGTVIENIGEGTIDDLENFEIGLGPGLHSIVLTISDGIHEVMTGPVNITVEKYEEPIWLYDIDTDNDGMPNWWEYAYRLGWDTDANGDPTYSTGFAGMTNSEIWGSIGSQYENGEVAITATNDFDSDGHSDYEEYLKGTDPTKEDEFPIYVAVGEEAEDTLDLFLLGLIIVAIVLLVVVLIFLGVNNVIIKKRIEDQKVKEAENEKVMMDQALSSGGLQRLEALRSASEGKPVALPGSQPMADALPSAPMGEAQPMGEAEPMGEAQPMAAPAPAEPAPIPQQMEAQPMNDNSMQQQL